LVVTLASVLVQEGVALDQGKNLAQPALDVGVTDVKQPLQRGR